MFYRFINFVQALVLGVCALLTYETASFAAQTTGSERPNIILIFTDDLGFGDVGMNGNTLIKTPNIDSLAEQGALLTDFHAASNICTPSRVGLLTGKYAVRLGLGVMVIYPKSTHGLLNEEVTLADALKSSGYRTGMFGKWHVGHQEGMTPTEQGFDKFVGVAYSHDMSPLPLFDGKEVIEKKADQASLTRRLTDEAISFIQSKDDSPFFVYLPYTAPHEPLLTENEFIGQSKAGAYGDVVEELDFHIGTPYQNR